MTAIIREDQIDPRDRRDVFGTQLEFDAYRALTEQKRIDETALNVVTSRVTLLEASLEASNAAARSSRVLRYFLGE